MKRQAFLRRLAGRRRFCLWFPSSGFPRERRTGRRTKRKKQVSFPGALCLRESEYVEAANDRLTLRCNPSDGALLVEDRQTGRVYRSNPKTCGRRAGQGSNRTNMSSQLLITAADTKGTVESYNSSVDSVGEGGLTVSSDHGRRDSRLFISSKKLGIAVPLCCHAK